MSERKISAVAVIQFEIETGAVRENMASLKKMLVDVNPAADTLIVLPELWATGFDYLNCLELAKVTPALIEELRIIAAEKSWFFSGSFLESPNNGTDKPWNTMFLVDGNGVIGKYRKQHLFALWKEDLFFASGNRPEPVTVGTDIVGPLICYDLRFPELARDHAFKGASMLIVSAQWPEVRLDHWQTLLKARAIENQAFVIGANGCGPVGEYMLAGHSMIIAPDGEIISEAGRQAECLQYFFPEDGVDKARDRFFSTGENPWLNKNQDKICSLPHLLAKVKPIKKQGSRIVFTNGCFDLLHPGHADYLEQARSCGDLLIVGLNSDRSVRALKGENRPVNSEQDRARVLAALGCVDFVVVFDEDTPLNIIKDIMPDILVKGADWSEEQIVGAAEVKAAGGRVERIIFAHQCSTTALIKKIYQSKECTLNNL